MGRPRNTATFETPFHDQFRPLTRDNREASVSDSSMSEQDSGSHGGMYETDETDRNSELECQICDDIAVVIRHCCQTPPPQREPVASKDLDLQNVIKPYGTLYADIAGEILAQFPNINQSNLEWVADPLRARGRPRHGGRGGMRLSRVSIAINDTPGCYRKRRNGNRLRKP